MFTLSELVKIWEEVVGSKVKNIEGSLFSDTSITTALSSAPRLWKVTESLQIGGSTFRRSKHLRTLLATTLLEGYTGIRPTRGSLKTGVLLDAIVNSADDLSDFNRKLPEDYVFKNTLIGYVSWSLFISEIAKEVQDMSTYAALSNELLEYIVKLARIPLVEAQTYQKIISTNEEIEAALECYFYRAVDIDIFVVLIGILNGLEHEGNMLLKLREIGKYVRAMRILAKDLDDLALDIELNQRTPLVALSKKYPHDTPLKFYSIIRNAIERVLPGI
ncbi:hypothetical protein [Palaeococcus sp. (in: euryarchaeotes)]